MKNVFINFALLFTALVFIALAGLKYILPKSLETYAAEIVEKCSSSTYPSVCYESEVPRLMDNPTNLSMGDAFKVTQIIQQKDSSYQYCHVLGHNLSTKETKKDLSKWKEVITRCPNGICANGCLHGSLMERFKSESLSDEQIEQLKPELEGICEAREGWNPTSSQQGFCFHGLGHLLMYATDADINKSIEICNLIASKHKDNDFSRLCFDGVFMQIFQQLDGEDIALVKGKVPAKEEVYNFCSQYPTKERGECMIQSWPKFQVEIMEPQGLVKFCSYTENQVEKRRCYHKSIGIVTTTFSQSNQNVTDKVREFCSSLPSQDREDKRCFATAAKRLVQNNIWDVRIASEICKQANSKETSDYCFNILSAYSKKVTHPGSVESKEYCSSLPDSC